MIAPRTYFLRTFWTLFFFVFVRMASAQSDQARLTPFQSDDQKYGYRDENREVSIRAQFDEARPFAGSYAAVRQGNQWGLINTKGKLVIPTEYENIGWTDNCFPAPDTTDGIVGYQQNGQWGLVTVKHKIIIPPTYDFLSYLSAGQMKASRRVDGHQQYGVITGNGTERIPLRYHVLTDVPGARAWVAGSLKIAADNRVCNEPPCHVYAYGLLDATGKEILPMQHQRIQYRGKRQFTITPFPEWKIVSSTGKEIAVAADSAYPVLPHTYAYSVNGAWEYVSAENPQWQVTIRRERILPRQASVSVFRSAGKSGAVALDDAGAWQECLPAQYDSLIIDKTGDIRAGVRSGKNWQWEWWQINTEGKTDKITPQSYQHIDEIRSNALVRVKQNEQWGYINLSGNEVIPPRYDSIGHFVDSLCVAVVDGTYGILKRNNTWLVEPDAHFYDLNAFGSVIRQNAHTTEVRNRSGKTLHISKTPLRFLADGSIAVTEKGKVGRISPTGVPCVPPQYDSISPMTTEQTFWAYRTGEIFLYRASGDKLIANGNEIEWLHYEPDKFAPVRTAGKYGFVDGLGRLRIANRYEDAQPFSEGLAAVKFSGKWGFLNEREKLAVQPYYDEVTPFRNGLAMVRKGKLWGVVDATGKERSDFKFTTIDHHATGSFITTVNSKKGWLNAEGTEILYVKYDTLIPQPDGKVVVGMHGKYGLLSGKGVPIHPIVYDAIRQNPYSGEYLLLKRAVPFSYTVAQAPEK